MPSYSGASGKRGCELVARAQGVAKNWLHATCDYRIPKSPKNRTKVAKNRTKALPSPLRTYSEFPEVKHRLFSHLHQRESLRLHRAAVDYA